MEIHPDGPPKCDFCSTRPVRWSYPARTFVRTIGVTDVGSDGNWAACEDCYALIQAGNRDALVKRSMALFPQNNPDMANLNRQERRVLSREIRRTQDSFWEHRLGEPTAERVIVEDTISYLPQGSSRYFGLTRRK